MKQKLQTSTSQTLTLTPQLQQSIKLLHLSSQELNEEIERALEENPLLERLDDPLEHTTRFQGDGSIIREQMAPSREDYSSASSAQENETSTSEDAIENYTKDHEENLLWQTHHLPDRQPDDERYMPQFEAPPETLQEHLLVQMRLNIKDQRERVLIELLIDALNTNGFLVETLEEMLEWLPAEINTNMEELERCLKILQSFDPPGIGARSSSECLSLQIQAMPNIPYVIRKRALLIVEKHLKLYAQRDIAKLKKVLGCDEEDLAEANKVIQSCSPHPGAIYGNDSTDTVIPEIIVVKKDDVWQAQLNAEVMPKIRVNQIYSDILKNSSGKSTLNTCFQEAKWLIRNINQRFETIQRVASAIVERQQNFFSCGPTAMKPLVLREIADILDLHESTISRVTTQKFMLTPLGIFELKYFFGSHVSTEDGGEASSTAIRERIKNLIATEDKKKPYSDSKIAQVLEKEGLVIARRTIAKYRDILKIPPANLRKSF